MKKILLRYFECRVEGCLKLFPDVLNDPFLRPDSVFHSFCHVTQWKHPPAHLPSLLFSNQCSALTAANERAIRGQNIREGNSLTAHRLTDWNNRQITDNNRRRKQPLFPTSSHGSFFMPSTLQLWTLKPQLIQFCENNSKETTSYRQ